MGKLATVLVCVSSIQACASFHFSQPMANLRQTPKMLLRNVFPAENNCCASSSSSSSSAMAPSARYLSGTSPRPSTECNARSEGRDDGGDEGDGVDYSADPLTAFLGKFLPGGEEKSSSPKAEDLVRLYVRANSLHVSCAVISCVRQCRMQCKELRGTRAALRFSNALPTSLVLSELRSSFVDRCSNCTSICTCVSGSFLTIRVLQK